MALKEALTLDSFSAGKTMEYLLTGLPPQEALAPVPEVQQHQQKPVHQHKPAEGRHQPARRRLEWRVTPARPGCRRGRTQIFR